MLPIDVNMLQCYQPLAISRRTAYLALSGAARYRDLPERAAFRVKRCEAARRVTPLLELRCHY
jgi:hypothetical protein